MCGTSGPANLFVKGSKPQGKVILANRSGPHPPGTLPGSGTPTTRQALQTLTCQQIQDSLGDNKFVDSAVHSWVDERTGRPPQQTWHSLQGVWTPHGGQTMGMHALLCLMRSMRRRARRSRPVSESSLQDSPVRLAPAGTRTSPQLDLTIASTRSNGERTSRRQVGLRVTSPEQGLASILRDRSRMVTATPVGTGVESGATVEDMTPNQTDLAWQLLRKTLSAIDGYPIECSTLIELMDSYADILSKTTH